jgi:hypothetical protein
MAYGQLTESGIICRLGEDGASWSAMRDLREQGVDV